MNKDTLRQLVVVIVVIATSVVSVLASALPLNGLSTGEISDRFQVFFVPAGYVFSIWGLIYIGMIALAVYQALPAQRDNPRLRAVGYPFALANVANIAWIFLWHYEQFPWTLLAMFALLVLLIVTYLWLGIGHSRASAGETWTVRVPVSLYLGWITVATIANVTSVLDYLGWNGGPISPQAWAVIMLAVTAVVAAAMAFFRRDLSFLLVILWAVAGIAVKHAGTTVALAAWVVAAVVVLLLVYAALRRGERSSLRPA